MAISLIVGTIVIWTLRVCGLVLRDQPLTRITRALLPYTWYGFALMALTGLPLFAAEAAKLYGNPAFRLKLLLLGLPALMHGYFLPNFVRHAFATGADVRRYVRFAVVGDQRL